MKLHGVEERQMVALAARITPRCRDVQGGDDAAFDEAVRRLREEYHTLLRLREDEPSLCLVLTVDRPGRA